jgi:hypothetical protein
MRIGTTAVNFSSLIPADVTPAEAIRRAQNFSIVGQVREVAEQGFDLIELSTDLTLLLPDAYSPAVVADLAALKDELGPGLHRAPVALVAGAFRAAHSRAGWLRLGRHGLHPDDGAACPGDEAVLSRPGIG